MFRTPRFGRAEAERLLDTGTGGPPALSALIAAVTPAAAACAPGEQQALAAFRAAQAAPLTAPTPHPRRFPVLKAALAQLIASKFAATAAVAAVATGGVALAAATGSLPTQGSTVAAPAVSDAPSSDAPSSEAPSSDAPSSDAPSTDAPSSSDSTSTSPGASDSPTPSLVGLCHAFQAGATSNGGKASANPAFTYLITTAGGPDKVADYCVTLIGPARGRPSQAATHDHGAPSTHPTGRPSGAGRPSDAGEPSDAGKPSGAGASTDPSESTAVGEPSGGGRPSGAGRH